VFVIGLAVIALSLMRQAGLELPATVPESLITIVLGSIATILVLVRLISIPEEFQPASRGIGIWISLAAAILVIVAGLLRASEEL
jgi:predicted membrane protein